MTQRELSRGRKIIFGLIAVGMGLAVVLVFAELVLRLMGLGVEVFNNNDPVLGHRFKANLDAHVWEMGRRIHYRTNSLGFRGPEPAATRDRPRVLMLGDSFTAGQDWHEEETFPRLLERSLGVEVVNLGVPAYDTGIQSVALEKIGLPLKPDVVVLNIFVGNDIRENSRTLSTLPRPTFSVGGDGALIQHPFTPRGARPGQWLLSRSALYAWQKHQVRKLFFRLRASSTGGDPMHAVFSSNLDDAWREAWQVTELLLVRIQEQLKAQGIPLLIVVIPDVVQVDDTAWSKMVEASPRLQPMQRDLPQEKLREIASRRGLTMLDLLPVLQAAGGAMGGEDPLYDGHLVRRGHRVTAEAMEPLLRPLLPARH